MKEEAYEKDETELAELALKEFRDYIGNNPKKAYEIFRSNPDIVDLMSISEIKYQYHLLEKGVGTEAAEELNRYAIKKLEEKVDWRPLDFVVRAGRELRRRQIQSN